MRYKLRLCTENKVSKEIKYDEKTISKPYKHFHKFNTIAILKQDMHEKHLLHN